MKYFEFSEFHEILLLLVKLCSIFMILCEMLLDLMKYIMKSIMKSDGFHMNLCWI